MLSAIAIEKSLEKKKNSVHLTDLKLSKNNKEYQTVRISRTSSLRMLSIAELPDKLLSVVSLATTHLFTDMGALGYLAEKNVRVLVYLLLTAFFDNILLEKAKLLLKLLM